jgi:uncharacterized delta-60 repeat protein
VAPGGRILVAGESGGIFKDLVLVRYLPDGQLDREFGEGGGVVLDLGGDDVARALLVQPDGKILVGGSGGRGQEDFVLLRCLPDGRLDEGFGQGGVVTTDFRGGADRGQALALLPDGRIVLGGVAQLSGGCSPRACERYGFALAQYTAAGQLDAGFGDGGKALPDFLSSAGAYGLARLPGGSLVLGGHIGNEEFALALFRADGRLDESFGDAGLLRTRFGTGAARAAAIVGTADGGLFAGGVSGGLGGESLDADFALARYRFGGR